MDRLIKYFESACSLAIIIWGILFSLFVQKTIDYRHGNFIRDKHIYNVVVLTGGRYRISRTTDFVNKNCTRSVFVSGVFPKTMQNHIFPPDKFFKRTPVVLGKKARNTHENAIEIKEWRKRTGINEILLITSDYHMIRSLLEIEDVNPDLKIIPYATKSKPDSGFLLNCLKEFHKIALFYIKKILNPKFSLNGI